MKSFIKPYQTSSIPPLFHENVYVADTNEKANLFYDSFAEQSVLDHHLVILPDPVNLEGPTLDSIHFSPTEVKDTLSTLKLGKASGLDNFNNIILKAAAVPLSNPL